MGHATSILTFTDGYVFFLSNPAMPGVLMLCHTYGQHPKDFAKNLTWQYKLMPPFEVEYLQLVQNPDEAVHNAREALRDYQVTGKSQCYAITVDDACERAIRATFRKRQASDRGAAVNTNAKTDPAHKCPWCNSRIDKPPTTCKSCNLAISFLPDRLAFASAESPGGVLADESHTGDGKLDLQWEWRRRLGHTD